MTTETMTREEKLAKASRAITSIVLELAAEEKLDTEASGNLFSELLKIHEALTKEDDR